MGLAVSATAKPLKMTVAQASREWGCARSTVYRRIKRLEATSNRPVGMPDVVHGRKTTTILRADLYRATRAMGLDEPEGEIQAIADEMEAIRVIVLELVRRSELQETRLKNIAQKLGV